MDRIIIYKEFVQWKNIPFASRTSMLCHVLYMLKFYIACFYIVTVKHWPGNNYYQYKSYIHKNFGF